MPNIMNGELGLIAPKKSNQGCVRKTGIMIFVVSVNYAALCKKQERDES